MTAMTRASLAGSAAAAAVALCALAGLTAGGCQERTLTFTVGGIVPDGGAERPQYMPPGMDGSRPDRTDAESDVGPADAGSDACTAATDRDPANCGACGNVCHFSGALPTCTDSLCKIDQCLPGFSNLNGREDDGCEYMCTVTQAATEVCDDIDNDCDGQIDEATDKLTDADNCGTCGRHCTFLHAGGSCSGGACVLGACNAGFVNANQMPADGCVCALSNGGTEICDGIDNDCNGNVDDVPAAGVNNDVQHCGACNRNCTTLPHALGDCSNAACVVVGCAFGFANRNNDASDGCEHACPGAGRAAPRCATASTTTATARSTPPTTACFRSPTSAPLVASARAANPCARPAAGSATTAPASR
jgi:hypothetical protein